MKKISFLILMLTMLIPTVALAINTYESDESYSDLISGQELKTKTVSEIANIYEIDANEYADALSEYYNVSIDTDDSFQLLHDNYGMEPSATKDIALAIKTGQPIEIPDKSKQRNGKNYHLIPISAVLVLTTVFSYLVSRAASL